MQLRPDGAVNVVSAFGRKHLRSISGLMLRVSVKRWVLQFDNCPLRRNYSESVTQVDPYEITEPSSVIFRS